MVIDIEEIKNENFFILENSLGLSPESIINIVNGQVTHLLNPSVGLITPLLFLLRGRGIPLIHLISGVALLP